MRNEIVKKRERKNSNTIVYNKQAKQLTHTQTTVTKHNKKI